MGRALIIAYAYALALSGAASALFGLYVAIVGQVP